MQRLFLYILIVLLASSCRKSEIELIENNQPPPDNTIESVTIENYINRAYILVLGREPDSVEYAVAIASLSANDLDSTSRKNFIAGIFRSPDYLPHLYNQNRIDLLNNIDTTEFSTWAGIFQLFLLDTNYRLQWPYIQYEIDRLNAVRNAYMEFTDSLIGIDELQRRMCNNYFYDQINMGSANFVISTFQNLINRNPTMAEQQAGVSMVDGSNAILFLQAGSSKNDYLDIFTHSFNYYEGQIILMYLRLLNRIPNSIEMADATSLYSSTGDYSSVQREILSSDEFIGL